MSKLKVAELFYSIQGEGKFMGVPSVFLRTFGCNFECRGFGLPAGERTTAPEEVAAQIDKYKTYEELPIVDYGCDSYASWHPKFKHLSPMLSASEIADKCRDILPNNEWDRTHLIFTGGEPLLPGWQRAYPELLEEPYMLSLQNITFETNGTQIITDEFENYLLNWDAKRDLDIDTITFSVSAKLSCSGEKFEDRFKPDVLLQYEEIGDTYLKFVVATKEDIAEAEKTLAMYRGAGFNGDCYLMPVGGTESSYNLNAKNVAVAAMERGLRYSDRLQVPLFKNEWGT